MKRLLLTLMAALCCLLCFASLWVYAAVPETQRVDWSMMAELGQDAGDHGWTVYVVREGEKILLEDKNGRYAGCEPGETFYYTRRWDAQTPQPVLRIHAVMPAIAVWLDDDLVYTDAPLYGDTIGQLTLPMLPADRESAVELTLEEAPYGHTLTIAQASPLESETGYAYVYPCDVEVVSAYGYERSLISQANRTGLMELALCGMAVLLCYLAWKRRDGALLLLALLAFLRLLGVIAGAAFFYQYTNLWGLDLKALANRLSFSVMLGFLAVKCGRERPLMAAMAVLHAASALAALAVQTAGLSNNVFVLISSLPDRLTLAFLAGAAVLSAMQARRSPFFALLCKLGLALSALGLAVAAVYFLARTGAWNRLLAGQVDMAILVRGAIVWIVQGAGIGAAAALAIGQLRAAREERVFAAVRAQAVEQSYETLQQHGQEVMALRHEIKRHDLALKGFLDEGDTARAREYLASLLKQQEQLPQVLHTENKLINIILGSRIASAQNAGLSVELPRMSVPPQLPLTDQETVSLVLNLVDNAIEAARKTEPPPGLLRLDMHQKNGFFVFTCENTLPGGSPAREPRLNTHGYGLGIIRRILEPHGELITTCIKDGLYSTTIALPLAGPAQSAALTAAPAPSRAGPPL